MRVFWIAYKIALVCNCSIWIQTASAQDPVHLPSYADSLIIERLRIARDQADKLHISNNDYVIPKDDAKMLRSMLDSLVLIKMQNARIERRNRNLQTQLDSMMQVMEQAERTINNMQHDVLSIRREVLSNDLLVIRTEQDITRLRREVNRTLRKNPRIKNRPILFTDNVSKKTKLFGYSIMSVVFLSLTVPLALAMVD